MKPMAETKIVMDYSGLLNTGIYKVKFTNTNEHESINFTLKQNKQKITPKISVEPHSSIEINLVCIDEKSNLKLTVRSSLAAYELSKSYSFEVQQLAGKKKTKGK